MGEDSFRGEAVNILGVDTSGEGLSLALGRGHEDCIQRRLRKCASDEHLFPVLRRLLERANLELKDIDAVAAACGPGRFTGIRVGMTFAQMLARSLGRPAVAVNRFEAWAAVSDDPGEDTKKRVHKCVVFPAGRGDAFVQLFRIAARGRHLPAGRPRWVPRADFEAELAKICRNKRVVVARYDFGDRVFPGFPASFLLSAACEKLTRGRVEPFRPLYLRPANYELKRKH